MSPPPRIGPKTDGQSDDRSEDRECLLPFVLGKHLAQHSEALRQHQRGEGALDQSSRDEDSGVGRDAAQRGRADEANSADQEHAASSDEVA